MNDLVTYMKCNSLKGSFPIKVRELGDFFIALFYIDINIYTFLKEHFKMCRLSKYKEMVNKIRATNLKCTLH